MDSIIQVVFLLLCLVGTCHAYSKFETNCSLPSSSVNYVSSPDSRGTLDIVWSSLFTLVTCTWSIQHLNVPEQRDPDSDKGFWADVKWRLKGVCRNVKSMIITMLAPEIIFGKAVTDLVDAIRTQDLMQKVAKEDEVEWSLSHSFFADMGGFMVVSENDPLNPFPLVAAEIHWLRTTERRGEPGKTKIEKLPDITTAELRDKSTGDAFLKIVSAGQVFWVAVQIIVRAAKGLPICLLELSVAAFSACAVFIYLILMYKPQGVGVPIRPIQCEPGSMEEVRARKYSFSFRFFVVPGDIGDYKFLKRRIPNHWFPAGENAMGVGIYPAGILVGSIVFGSCHIAGWNFTYPTHIEKWLWRVSSIFLAIAPLLFLMFMTMLDNFNRGELIQQLNFVFAIVYVLVRVFMLVEILRTLLYLPPDVYISTWTSSLPHVT